MKVSSEGGRISSADQKNNLGRLEGCIFCTCIHYTHFAQVYSFWCWALSVDWTEILLM